MPRPRRFPEETPIGALARRLAILEGSQVFTGLDADAIHDDVAAEILAVALKATPTSTDLLLIEDVADSNEKKRITISSLPSAGAGSSLKTDTGPDASDFWEIIEIDGGDSLIIRQWDDSAAAFLERIEIVGKGAGISSEGDVIFRDLDGVEIFRFNESLDRVQFAAGRGKIDFAGGGSDLSSINKIHSFGADLIIQAESTGSGPQDLSLEADDGAGVMRTRMHVFGIGDISLLKVDGTTVSVFWDQSEDRWKFTDPPAGIAEPIIFSMDDVLVTKIGQARFYPPYDIIITDVRISVGTAPTGATIEVDVNKNGTTIFTTQSNRPIIATSGFFDLSGTPDITAYTADTDYISVDIDQVGSTIAGKDLVVTILAVHA